MDEQAAAMPNVNDAAFPAQSRTIDATIADLDTTITRVSFADKIIVTLSQDGRLNQWTHVPMASTNPTSAFVQPIDYTALQDGELDTTLLPPSHLTATTLLGGTKPDLEILGQTLATNVAAAILSRNRDESRVLVLGIGLDARSIDGDAPQQLLSACLDVL